MKLSEQIKDKEIRFNIANDCVQLIEDQVNAKKGVSGVAFKTLYKGVKAISSNYVCRAIMILLPSVSEAIDPLWEEGIQQGDPVQYAKDNKSLTADTILSVTDVRISDAKNKIVRVTYNKIRDSLKDEVEQAVPGLVDIIDKNIPS